MKQRNKKLLICIVGESGSGKTELTKYLLKNYNWAYVSSYTTRPMRDGETNGVEHTFVSVDEKPEESEMIAYTKFGDYEYWATKSQVSHNPTTYVIDEKGVVWLKEKFSDEFNIKTVYVKRDNRDDIDDKRKERDNDRELFDEKDYDVVIHNDYESVKLFMEAAGETLYKEWLIKWRFEF